MQKKLWNILVLTTCLSAAIPEAYAASSESLESASTSYTLPKALEQRIQQSSVLVSCGKANASAIAISPLHLMTAAHPLVGYKITGESINIMVLQGASPIKFMDTELYKLDGQLTGIYKCHTTDAAKHILGTRAYFPEKTVFVPATEEAPTTITAQYLMEGVAKEAAYCREDAIAFTRDTPATSSYALQTPGGYKNQTYMVSGPDIAIIECAEPHGVPFMPMIDAALSLETLFISGVGGRRYNNKGEYAGGIRAVKSKPMFIVKPEIYAQPFVSLAASEEDATHRVWINKVPLIRQPDGIQIFEDEFLVPGAPQGFGLITKGDSGAGAVIVRGGVPYLAGIAGSAALPQYARKAASEQFLSYARTMQAQGKSNELSEAIFEIVTQPAFVTQIVEDISSQKAWIHSIIASAEATTTGSSAGGAASSK